MPPSGLFISAGDMSGDIAASRVLGCLRARVPGLTTAGLGGPRLRQEGQRQLAEFSDLTVMGFLEVARRFSFFRRLMDKCEEEIRSSTPSAILLVDYPGFNLRLAARVKDLRIPIIYYISPQLWAWGKRRIKQVKSLVSRMIVILPFEEDFYRSHNVPCDFVGHYLIEDIPNSYIASQPPGQRMIALLPGSRTQEIRRILPPMVEAAKRLAVEHGTTAVVAAVEGAFEYESLVTPDGPVSIVYGKSRDVVRDADIAMVASGTATLETGIIGRPMVVGYKAGWTTYQIARRLVKLDHISLVNLVLNQRVVPELIQFDLTPQRLYDECLRLLTDIPYYDATREQLNLLPSRLGGEGASERTAEIVAGYLS